MNRGDVMNNQYNIEVLPTGKGDAVFAQRECGVAHTPYETEKVFYSCIKAGDVSGVEEFFGQYLAQGIYVGRLSPEPLTQMKYFAVCCVTLACRYAIAGGMDEAYAFNYSDDCIRLVDKMKSEEEIMRLLTERARELAAKVGECKAAGAYAPPIRRCINYINRNLHGRITLSALAAHCGLSADYLSSMFRKSVGISVSRYVTGRKLEASKALLNGGYSVSEASYQLGFATESYYISCFRRAYGVTPAVWKAESADGITD